MCKCVCEGVTPQRWSRVDLQFVHYVVKKQEVQKVLLWLQHCTPTQSESDEREHKPSNY